MKQKFTFLNLFFVFFFVSASFGQSINDFESVAPNNVVRYAATFAIVPNPVPSAINNTTRIGRTGRTGVEWFEMLAFNNPSIPVP